MITALDGSIIFIIKTKWTTPRLTKCIKHSLSIFQNLWDENREKNVKKTWKKREINVNEKNVEKTWKKRGKNVKKTWKKHGKHGAQTMINLFYGFQNLHLVELI